jgi:signal transduction histidine kinase
MNDKGTILVIDDTHASLKLLTDLLTAEGYEVRPADSGALALASVTANPPALILLDILMPDMDGFEVFRRLKAHPEHRHIPVIFISALTETEQRVEGLKLGAVDFISKPFQREELLARVKLHLELSQLRTGLEQMVAERTHELRDAQEKLVRQEKLAVLGQMAGSVGHELRNPLSIIKNAVYYLKLVQPDANDKVKEYLDIITSEIGNSDKIISDLLDFARPSSNERQTVAVFELVRQTLERFPAPPAVQVTLDIPEGLPPVYADLLQLTQVLGNLVINACQAMASPAGMGSQSSATLPEGGKLTLSASTQGDMIEIKVQDTGAGIPPENMSKLFEPLFTTKAKGIGLGLAVSQKLVEANGGWIEVQSEAGQGSVFTVYLHQQKESQ